MQRENLNCDFNASVDKTIASYSIFILSQLETTFLKHNRLTSLYFLVFCRSKKRKRPKLNAKKRRLRKRNERNVRRRGRTEETRSIKTTKTAILEVQLLTKAEATVPVAAEETSEDLSRGEKICCFVNCIINQIIMTRS